MAEIALVGVFAGLPDRRRKQGRRHSLPLCLALFTLAVAAGNQGFLAIGDWLKSYKQQLKELFEVDRLPSYSTVRRALLALDYKEYSRRLAQFFGITPLVGETLALDGKVLRGSYLLETDNPHCESHKAITLVTAYLVERGLILPPCEVKDKSNEITAIPEFIKVLAVKGVVFAFDSMNTQKKTINAIVDSGNHYLAAVKDNQPTLNQAIQAEFVPIETDYQANKGHGRLEKRRVSICQAQGNYPDWPQLNTIIRVEYERQTKDELEQGIRYYISDLTDSARDFGQRIRGYWGVENKVHYVRDVTQGEDKSRIRTKPLPQIMAIARNLALNLYRDAGFDNMAQAQRKCKYGLERILDIFSMK